MPIPLHRPPVFPDFSQSASADGENLRPDGRLLWVNLNPAEDFALELNLGFQHQYEYAISAKQFSQSNKLHVVMFYTDSLQLCLKRAKLRYENGLHLVRPEIIIQMYDNTIPLFIDKFDKIDKAVFVKADLHNKFSLVAVYGRSANELELHDSIPDWFKNELLGRLTNRIGSK